MNKTEIINASPFLLQKCARYGRFSHVLPDIDTVQTQKITPTPVSSFDFRFSAFLHIFLQILSTFFRGVFYLCFKAEIGANPRLFSSLFSHIRACFFTRFPPRFHMRFLGFCRRLKLDFFAFSKLSFSVFPCIFYDLFCQNFRLFSPRFS